MGSIIHCSCSSVPIFHSSFVGCFVSVVCWVTLRASFYVVLVLLIVSADFLSSCHVSFTESISSSFDCPFFLITQSQERPKTGSITDNILAFSSHWNDTGSRKCAKRLWIEAPIYARNMALHWSSPPLTEWLSDNRSIRLISRSLDQRVDEICSTDWLIDRLRTRRDMHAEHTSKIISRHIPRIIL